MGNRFQESATKGELIFDSIDGIFDCYIPQDNQHEVSFSFGNGNLLDYTLQKNNLTGNYGYLLGQGELKNRIVFEGGDSESITQSGRKEFVSDARSLSIQEEFDNELATQLKKRATALQLKATCLDTPVARYGTDYQVGSKVSVYLPQLAKIEERIREVRFTYDAKKGEIVQPTIGTIDYLNIGSTAAFFEQQRKLAKRISNLERNT